MLEGKVAIITGGTRGIGFAIAKKYLESNAKVIIFGSRNETVEKAVKELKSLNDKYEIDGYYPNLTDEQNIENTFNEIESKYGHIDILVNNAGISSRTKIEDYTDEEYEKGKVEAENMERYPKDGSIRELDDCIIINF